MRRLGLYPSPWSRWHKSRRLGPHLVKSHAANLGANVRLRINSSIRGYPSRRQSRSPTTRPICHLICASCSSSRRKRRTTSLPIRSCTVRINRTCRTPWTRSSSSNNCSNNRYSNNQYCSNNRYSNNRYNNQYCSKRNTKVRVAPTRVRLARTRRLPYNPHTTRTSSISNSGTIISSSLA